MKSFRLVPTSEGPRREFKITLGLRAGHGSAGRILLTSTRENSDRENFTTAPTLVVLDGVRRPRARKRGPIRTSMRDDFLCCILQGFHRFHVADASSSSEPNANRNGCRGPSGSANTCQTETSAREGEAKTSRAAFRSVRDEAAVDTAGTLARAGFTGRGADQSPLRSAIPANPVTRLARVLETGA
jgi:hypothetical protein